MKTLCLIIIVITFNQLTTESCPVIFKEKATVDSISEKAKKLKSLYMLSIGSIEVRDIYQKQFFDEFPKTFRELNELYGYDWDKHKGASILYYEAGKHIRELFNDLDNINDTLYYKKIIGIAIDGHWDADAVNFFQYGLRNRTEAKPELITFILKTMPENQIRSFWYFYFDGAHPKKIINEPLQKIKSFNLKIYNLMLQVHHEVIVNTEEH
ncbi:MAG: hypothetical protein M3N14_00710 [Bacteroidota bacterium]|nr:hypothetical protein [Bacteroidota bacterium]